MGITSQAESVIYHFSHIHPLQVQRPDRFVQANQTTIKPNCCEPNADSDQLGPIYGCDPCNFFLHRACAELLPMVRHPAHPEHTLALVTASPYLKGSVVCDACTTTIHHFFYHCTHCSFDIHTHCAFLPPTTDHASHHHQLDLLFSSSYETGSHVCDLCGESLDGRSWIYRCNLCGFDTHVDCALAWPGGVLLGSPTLAPMNPPLDLAPPAQDPDTPILVGEQDPSFGTGLDRGSNPNSEECEGYLSSSPDTGVGDELRNFSPEHTNVDRDRDVEWLQMTLAKARMLPGVGVIGMSSGEHIHGGRYG